MFLHLLVRIIHKVAQFWRILDNGIRWNSRERLFLIFRKVCSLFYTTAQQIQEQDFRFQITLSLHYTSNRGPRLAACFAPLAAASKMLDCFNFIIGFWIIENNIVHQKQWTLHYKQIRIKERLNLFCMKSKYLVFATSSNRKKQ